MKQKINKTLIIILMTLAVIFSIFVAFVIKVGRQASAELEEQYNTGHYDDITPYNESNSRTYGYGGDERSIDFEAFYGIKHETHDETVDCTPYSNIGGIALNEITLNSIDNTWEERVIKNLPTEGLDNTFTFDTSDLYNGKFDAIYTVSARFNDSSDNKEHAVTGYLHIKNSIPKCCRLSDSSRRIIDENLTEYHKIVDALNPADYLDDSKLCYPTIYYGNNNLYKSSYSCVKDYQTLSDQLVDGTWSVAAKVYAFVHYMTDNYAYDVS
ncbi:MAG: hypothetical protein K5865_04570 [Eubacterium sp.]|nr:hypothetical protein [Eubacterium sp.]